MQRAEIIEKLFENQDIKYRDFHAKLVPGTDDFIGVRVPIIKALAKEIAKGKYLSYLEQTKAEYYEERMLYGLVLGAIRKDFDTVNHYLREFVPRIDNWAVCDSLCTSLKEVTKHRAEMLPYFLECCRESQEFTIRFGVVMLMSYYIDDEHIELVLNEFDAISSDAYYVRMGVAWAVSVCFVKCRERTLQYLYANKMDNWTHNKSIQKITESLRVSHDDKALVRTLKRTK